MSLKVIIVGGSVAGLALANMLEQNGIDYLVLEKYSQVAPQLGASIAIMANGARLLDQLGCWDALTESLSEDDMFHHAPMRDSRGRVISSGVDFQKKLTDRWGYNFVFVDRQSLVQTLYDNIKDKSKVLVNKTVVQVEQSVDRATVLTDEGECFSGTIVVGADGVHSVVRKEMWRLANAEKPGSFSKFEEEANNVPCNYSCIFGISRCIEGFDLKSSCMIRGEGHSYLVSSGPGGKIYWFLFEKLDETSHGLYEKLPRYTDAQRDELARKHFGDCIAEELGLTFGTLWDNRTAATLTALPEYVMSEWHYGRIITVGDAVHKFNPIAGQGGNSAFETCATLANELRRAQQNKGTGATLDARDISELCEHVQSHRYDRAIMLKKTSTNQQAMFAQETLFWRMFNRFVVPYLGDDQTVDLLWNSNKGATRLEMFEVPARPRKAPFDDERPSSAGSATQVTLWSAAFCGLVVGVVYSNYRGVASLMG